MKISKIITALLWITLAAPLLYSHGTKYEIVKSGEIGVRAMYDTGEVMAFADVLVFPPGAASSAYPLKADDKGLFSFTPDMPGTWTFQVRDTSGHGMRINLKIDESLSLKSEGASGNGLNMLQKLVMALSIIWGAIGTALYFKGRRG